MDKIQRFDTRNALSWSRSNEAPEALRRWHLDLFTPRGWLTLASGALMVFIAYLLGRHELMALGIALFVLALSSWLLVLRSRRATNIKRVVHSASLSVADVARVTLECPDEVVINETLPEGFGPGPQLQGPGSLDYEIVFRSRGVHLLGPARQVISDPLGLIRGLVSVGQPQPVAVNAELLPLAKFASLGDKMLSGDTRFSRSTTADYYDVATRDYQQGDSIRQVHWKATARHGKLMVRQEDHVATAQAFLILDRTLEHWLVDAVDLRISIPQGEHPEISSSRRFENALSLASSIGFRYAGDGFQVQFKDLTGANIVADGLEPQSARGAQSGFEDFHQSTAQLSLVSSAPANATDDLLAPRLHRELQGMREEPVIMILGNLSVQQAMNLAVLSRSVRHVELYLLLAHPERHTDVAKALSKTGWKINMLAANATVIDARGI